MDYGEDNNDSTVSNISASSAGDSQGSVVSSQRTAVSDSTQESYDDVGVVKCICPAPSHLVRLVEVDERHAPIPPTICDMWRDGELCDVTLVADGVELPAHRLVLASVSPYFRTLFGVGLTDSKSPTINIVNFSADILRKILKYIYEQEMCLDRGEELDVIIGLDYLQLVEGAGMGWLEERCWALAETHLCHTSAVRTLAVADKSRLGSAKKLAEVALQFITSHIEEVMEEKEHVFLAKDHLIKIMDSREFKLRYNDELRIILVTEWMKADWPARRDSFWELSSFVDKTEKVEMIKQLIGFELDAETEEGNPPQKKIRLKSEALDQHDVEDRIILVFEAGSYDIHYFDIINSTWGVFAGADTPGNHDLFDGRLLSTDNAKILFSASAFDGGHIVKSIEMWADRPKFTSFNQNLHKGFVISAGCMSGDELFLHNGVSEKLNVCRRAVSARLRRPGEMLHPSELGLRPVQSIDKHTKNCTLIRIEAVCDGEGEQKLLAIGGENKLMGVSKQRSVTMYSDDMDCSGMVSQPQADMSVGRAKPAVAFMSGRLYVMGGEGGLDHDNTYEPPDLNQAQDLQLYNDENAEHRHCEAYSPVTDTWERIADLGHGLVRICGGGVARGRVVVVGLDKNGGVVVSEYNPCSDQWKVVAVRNFSGAGKPGVVKACVIQKPEWLVNKLKVMDDNVADDDVSDCSGFHNKCFTESEMSSSVSNSTLVCHPEK